MELQLGPLLHLEGAVAVVFSRVAIVSGVLTVTLFLFSHRWGALLAMIWSAWWAGVFATIVVSVQSLSDVVGPLVTCMLFLASGIYSYRRLLDRPSSSKTSGEPEP